MPGFDVTRISLWVVLLTLCLAGPASSQGLKINEFMSSAIEREGEGETGGRGTSRKLGEAPDRGSDVDWIEICNVTDEAIDVGGLYLTDDLQSPMKWQIPDDAPWETTISPKGYLLILADGDPAQGPLHANFGLKKAGEAIGLYHNDGRTLIDSIKYDQQVTNVSLGRYPNAGDQWHFYDRPTPGAENTGAGFLGLVADAEFSVQRGFYEETFDVVLTCPTPGATIHYTLDGTDPPELATPYTGPITVYTGPISVSATTCLRAAAFSTNHVPSIIRTHTYIFVDDVIDQPVMSTRITQDPVWGPQMHDALLEIPTISLVTPSTIPDEPVGSPPEVPVSIEMIFPDGTQGFQANAGVERFGGEYTLYAKQALRISFKRLYGPSRLKFDLFGDTPYGGENATDSFNQIILRNGSHDALWYDGYPHSRGVYTRNRYCFDRQMEMGHLSLRGKFVHVYLNGVYWGQYHLMERPTADFMAAYLGGDEEAYDIMKGRSGVHNKEGDSAAWDTMVTHTSDYDLVQAYLDIDNYIDYMLLNFYGGNDHDWYPAHNWVAGRRREPGGKFMFFMWDNDFLMRVVSNNAVNNGGPGSMLNSLKQHEEFRMRFADRAQAHLFNGGMLTPARVQADFTELTNRIARTIIPECARWSQAGSGGTYTPDSLDPYVDWIKFEYATSKIDVVIQQMRDHGIFPRIDAPVFSQHGGPIAVTEPLSMTASAGVIYYTLDGADPRLPGGTDPRGPGGVVNTGHAIEYTDSIILTASTSLKARALSGDTWSALNEAVFSVGPVDENLRITEIMYNPQDPNAEFIELQNIGQVAINLNLVRLEDGITFTFPSMTLAPQAYVLVVKDVDVFESLYGPALPMAGQYEGVLSNKGEHLRLVDAADQVIHDFGYDDKWHKSTDGDGYSLVLTQPASSDPTQWGDQTLWSPSLALHGSPGD